MVKRPGLANCAVEASVDFAVTVLSKLPPTLTTAYKSTVAIAGAGSKDS